MSEYRCRLTVEFPNSEDRAAGYKPMYRDIVLPFAPYPNLTIANIAADPYFDYVAEVVVWDHENERFDMVVDVDLADHEEAPRDFLGSAWKALRQR